MTLEKKLVRLRKKEGMSQADVSEKLNVSRQAVSRWEAGDSRPSIENLQALCKLYNVKLDDLLDESTLSGFMIDSRGISITAPDVSSNYYR